MLGLLLALRVGLLMRGMREFEWHLLLKSFSMAIGSRRYNIKVANYEYMVRLWSWGQNFIKFYCKLWNLRYVWWSVNTNNNFGTIVWERNLHHIYLIICMTHWKFGHIGWCTTISNEHRDTASCFVSTICMKAGVTLNTMTSVGREPYLWKRNNVLHDLIQMQMNEIRQKKLKNNVFFLHDKSFQLEILQHY